MSAIDWKTVRDYRDIRFEKADGIAKITIDRPEVRNAFRPQTLFELIDAFSPIRQDLIRTTYAAHFVELLDAFTEEADSSPPLYQLLVDGLEWLGQTTDLRRSARYYELHLLDLAGYRPELFTCVVCGEPIQAHDQLAHDHAPLECPGRSLCR